MLEVSTALSSTLDMDELMTSIMAHISQVLAFDFASVMLLDGERLLVTACNDLQQPEDLSGKTFPINEYPNFEVLNKKNPSSMKASIKTFLNTNYPRDIIFAPIFQRRFFHSM